MRFRPGAKLDTGQVTDARGRSGGGLALGGGGLGVVGLVIYLLIALLGGGGGLGGSSAPLDDPVGRGRHAEQISGRTAGPARTRTRARTAASSATSTASSSTGTATSPRSGRQYQRRTVFFTDAIQTGCGNATSGGRAVLLPGRRHVYIDLGFFDELRTQLRCEGRAVRAGLRARARVRPPRPGPARRARQSRQRTQGAESGSVRPSCRPTATPASGRATPSRPAASIDLTQADIPTASTPPRRSATTGSRQQTQGQVDPETWTHGSSAQRQRWFRAATTPASRRPATRSPARSRKLRA